MSYYEDKATFQKAGKPSNEVPFDLRQCVIKFDLSKANTSKHHPIHIAPKVRPCSQTLSKGTLSIGPALEDIQIGLIRMIILSVAGRGLLALWLPRGEGGRERALNSERASAQPHAFPRSFTRLGYGVIYWARFRRVS